jgi:hypothetical protein
MSRTPYWFCFRFIEDQLQVILHRPRSARAQSVGAEMLDKGPRDLVAVLKQQLFELLTNP